MRRIRSEDIWRRDTPRRLCNVPGNLPDPEQSEQRRSSAPIAATVPRPRSPVESGRRFRALRRQTGGIRGRILEFPRRPDISGGRNVHPGSRRHQFEERKSRLEHRFPAISRAIRGRSRAGNEERTRSRPAMKKIFSRPLTFSPPDPLLGQARSGATATTQSSLRRIRPHPPSCRPGFDLPFSPERRGRPDASLLTGPHEPPVSVRSGFHSLVGSRPTGSAAFEIPWKDSSSSPVARGTPAQDVLPLTGMPGGVHNTHSHSYTQTHLP